MKKKRILEYIYEMTNGYNGSYESYFEDFLHLKTHKEKETWFKAQFDCHGNTIRAVLNELNVRY